MNTKDERRIPLFCIVTSMFWFSLYAYVPELSTYADTLGATYQFIGVITGAYGLTQTFVRIPLGILSDKVNKRKLFIIIGLMISVISSLVVFIQPRPVSLLITRLLAGVAASTWVTFTVLFSSYYKDEESPKAIGIINSFNATGQMVAMIIGGFISLWFGTRYLFLLAAVGGTIGLLLSIGIYEKRDISREPMKVKDILEVITNKYLLFVAILAILSQFMTFATVFGFTPIVAKRLGANGFELSLLTTVSVLPGIFVAALAGTTFSKWWGAKNTILIGFLISSILCVSIPFVPNLYILYLVQFASGVGRNMVFPLLMGLGIKKFSQQKRATAMGAFQAIYGIGMVIGPIVLGFVGQKFGLTTGFIITGGIGCVAIIIIKLFSPQY